MSHIHPGTHEFGLSEPVMVILDADQGLEEKAFISRLEMVDGRIIGYWVAFKGGVEILINASYAHEQLRRIPAEPTRKRRIINAGRIARHYRRLLRCTEWTLTEAGRAMLGNDPGDSDDYPRWDDSPIISPTGNPIAELSY